MYYIPYFLSGARPQTDSVGAEKTKAPCYIGLTFKKWERKNLDPWLQVFGLIV